MWKRRWRSIDKTGGTLCYLPDRVYRSVVATMVLHNIWRGLGGGRIGLEVAIWKGGIVNCSGVVELEIILF